MLKALKAVKKPLYKSGALLLLSSGRHIWIQAAFHISTLGTQTLWLRFQASGPYRLHIWAWAAVGGVIKHISTLGTPTVSGSLDGYNFRHSDIMASVSGTQTLAWYAEYLGYTVTFHYKCPSLKFKWSNDLICSWYAENLGYTVTFHYKCPILKVGGQMTWYVADMQRT